MNQPLAATQRFLSKRPTYSRWLVTSLPLIWLTALFLIPFFIIIKISFSSAHLSIPPFMPFVETLQDYHLRVQVFFTAYARLLTDPFYGKAILNSLSLAAVATGFCLLLGYPMAYGISRANSRHRSLLLLLVILPFWISFLIRVYVWMDLLAPQGIINGFLLFLGIIRDPLPLLYNSASVIIGFVYCYIPFMILPIYATLLKIEPAYIEASSDLGGRPWRTFMSITLPLSVPGIISGCLLVFIPATGEYVIPELLGGSDSLMLGRVIWMEFFGNRDWPQACALAVIMVFMLVIPIVFLQRRHLQSISRETSP